MGNLSSNNFGRLKKKKKGFIKSEMKARGHLQQLHCGSYIYWCQPLIYFWQWSISQQQICCDRRNVLGRTTESCHLLCTWQPLPLKTYNRFDFFFLCFCMDVVHRESGQLFFKLYLGLHVSYLTIIMCLSNNKKWFINVNLLLMDHDYFPKLGNF